MNAKMKCSFVYVDMATALKQTKYSVQRIAEYYTNWSAFWSFVGWCHIRIITNPLTGAQTQRQDVLPYRWRPYAYLMHGDRNPNDMTSWQRVPISSLSRSKLRQTSSASSLSFAAVRFPSPSLESGQVTAIYHLYWSKHGVVFWTFWNIISINVMNEIGCLLMVLKARGSLVVAECERWSARLRVILMVYGVCSMYNLIDVSVDKKLV